MSRLVEIGQRMLSIADIGLQFAKDDYERDRHREVRALGLELLSLASRHSVEELESVLTITDSYPTPKVDVRAVVFDEKGRLLFVRERVDGKWALPGGWADIGYTPKETAEKECQEEAGVTVEAEAVWMVVDKRGWGHPVPLYPTYKIFLHCRHMSGEPAPGYEVSEAAWFGPGEVPELSTERLTKLQVEYLFKKREDPGMPTRFN